MDGDRILPIFGAAPNAEEGCARAARDGVGVITDDASLQQHASEKHGWQRLWIDLCLAQIAFPHFPDDLPLVQQVAEHLPLDNREPLAVARILKRLDQRSEEHTSELQSLMRTSYAVFCL